MSSGYNYVGGSQFIQEGGDHNVIKVGKISSSATQTLSVTDRTRAIGELADFIDYDQLRRWGTVLTEEAERGDLPRGHGVERAVEDVLKILHGAAPRAAVLLGEAGCCVGFVLILFTVEFQVGEVLQVATHAAARAKRRQFRRAAVTSASSNNSVA